MDYPTIGDTVGGTPLVALRRLGAARDNVLLAKLEGHGPAGSVKDRPARNMILRAEERGDIESGDTLIEPTSGNTGIALAMIAAARGYRMVLIMPENMSHERRAMLKAYGAELIMVPEEGGIEAAIDLARCMERDGEGKMLDQFSNRDNPQAHYTGTGPEIWCATHGRITHFVSAMGTTGTIMGTGRYLKEQNQAVRIVGVQPAVGTSIPGIRRWVAPYVPKIYDRKRVDRLVDITQQEAEETTRALAREEGIFCGVSSGGAVSAALKINLEVEGATIVTIICDRGDRYLSTNVFPG